MYEMIDIGKETYENNDIEIIVDGIGTLWLNEKHVEEKSGHEKLPVITNKYDSVYKKHRYEFVDKPKKQPNKRVLHSGSALKVIMGRRTNESCNLKKKLGFNLHDVINTKDQAVLKSMKDAFKGESLQTQYSFLGYRIDLYFHKHKLAIEVGELEHADRNLSNEIELNCVFIRINPDKENFNIFNAINKIHRYIKK